MRLARWPLAVLAAAAVFLAAWYWPHVRNEFFVVAGNRNEAGGWYGWHSGAGGAAYITIPVAALTLWWHHTCHVSTCLRPGRHPVEGTAYRTCRRHHPARLPARVTPEHIASAHREAQ